MKSLFIVLCLMCMGLAANASKENPIGSAAAINTDGYIVSACTYDLSSQPIAKTGITFNTGVVLAQKSQAANFAAWSVGTQFNLEYQRLYVGCAFSSDMRFRTVAGYKFAF